MTSDHPTTEMLDRLMAGTLNDLQVQKQAVEHLVAQCEVCLRYMRAVAAERAEELAAGDGGAEKPPAASGRRPALEEYDGLPAGSLERTAARRAAIRKDRLEVAACWATLRGTARGRRLRLVTGDPRFHQWGVAARLLEDAAGDEGRRAVSPQEARRLALAIAERLPPGRYPASEASDLRARAWMVEGEERRLEGRLSAAWACLGRARLAHEAGSGDALERAALLVLEAELDLDAGELVAAAARLRRAAGIFRALGERHEEGRALYRLATAVGFELPVEGAVTVERALALIEPGRDVQLDLAARHALIWFLNDAGMGWEALGLLDATRRLYRQLGDSPPRRLLPWLEARICRRLGELAAAERGLAAAWREMTYAGMRQEVALVSLDLASVFLERERPRAAGRLLGLVGERLRKWGMHAAGLRVWEGVRGAVARAEVTGGCLGEDGDRPGPAWGGDRRGYEVGGDGRAGAGPAEGDGVGALLMTRKASLYFRRAWRRPLEFAG
jgi:hypothetical protein